MISRNLNVAIDKSKMTKKEVAEKADISYKTLSRWTIDDDSNPGSLDLHRVARVLGTTVDELIENGDSNLKHNYDSNEGVPFYDLDVAAHISESLIDPSITPEYMINFQPFNDCTAFLPVYGDSMFPKIKSGDIIAIKQVTNQNIILWGEAHVVVTGAGANNMRTVKLIFPCDDDKNKIILRASNPGYKGDTIIDRCDIISLYIVKGIVTRNQL